jgi:hypothetical protein
LAGNSSQEPFTILGETEPLRRFFHVPKGELRTFPNYRERVIFPKNNESIDLRRCFHDFCRVLTFSADGVPTGNRTAPPENPKNFVEYGFRLIVSELEQAGRCKQVRRKQAKNTVSGKSVANPPRRAAGLCIRLPNTCSRPTTLPRPVEFAMP